MRRPDLPVTGARTAIVKSSSTLPFNDFNIEQLCINEPCSDISYVSQRRHGRGRWPQFYRLLEDADVSCRLDTYCGERNGASGYSEFT